MIGIYKEKVKDYFDGIAGEYNSACAAGKEKSVREYIFSSRKKHVLAALTIGSIYGIKE